MREKNLEKNIYIWKVKVLVTQSCLTVCNPWTVAHQAPLSLEFSRQEHGVGCHFLLQCMKVKSESEVPQSCPTLCDPMDCSLPGSSAHGIFQTRVLEWGAIAFSEIRLKTSIKHFKNILKTAFGLNRIDEPLSRFTKKRGHKKGNEREEIREIYSYKPIKWTNEKKCSNF